MEVTCKHVHTLGVMQVKNSAIFSFSNSYCVQMSLIFFIFLYALFCSQLTVVVRAAYSHDMLRLSIQGLMLRGQCGYDLFSFFISLCSGAGWIRLFRHAGMGMDDLFSDHRRIGLVPIFLAEN